MVTEVAIPPGETDRVRAHWQRLGLPGIVDVHTHFMPDRVLAKVWDFFDGVGERTGRPWPIAYRGSDEERVRRLHAYGVRAFTALAYPHKADMADWLNGWTMPFAGATPGCVGSATFFPEPGAGAYVAAALADGAKVFKAHVQVGGYDPTDPLLDPVWGALADAGAPVVLHAGSGPHPGRFTGPDRVATVLARHPRLTLVIAHMGLPEYAEFLDLAERYPRVHLDTTMVFTPFTEETHPFPTDELARLAQLGDRVVFGSDFPNIPYPYVDALDAVAGLGRSHAGLDDDWLRAVLHDNGARLLGVADES